MKTIKISLIAIVTLFAIVSVQAQTVDEIIDKYIDAIGGKDVLSKLKSKYIESEITISAMNDLSWNTAISFPLVGLGGSYDFSEATTIAIGKGYKYVLTYPKDGWKYILYVTSNDRWATNKKQKPQSVQPWLYQFSKVKGQMGGSLIHYATNGSKVELSGKEDWGFTNVYRLKLTDNTNRLIGYYYIDAKTYYLIKIEEKNIVFSQKIKKNIVVSQKWGNVTITFSNYQKVDNGYVMPFTISVATQVWNGDKVDEINAVSTIKKMVINQDVDPNIFEKPK